ncbi:flavodoxin family protein [Ruminococcaceae bacterium OttesenSCG-928-D13]|nr:flavodoxin family protein [Ruminococcaceae bacterium OttesenSCG-928-D13]
MRVLLINGSPHEAGCTHTALGRVAETLEGRGVKAELYHIGKAPVGGCTACGACGKTGRCAYNDGVNRVLEMAGGFDGFVFGAPVYYASPNGSMVAFMDRLFQAGGGALRHKPAAVVASARRGGCTAAIDVLAKYPTINQMPLVSGDYWPIVHGNTSEQVLQDAEGMFTMETVGRDMAWLLRCIEAGRAAGIMPDIVEKEAWTNFIR